MKQLLVCRWKIISNVVQNLSLDSFVEYLPQTNLLNDENATIMMIYNDVIKNKNQIAYILFIGITYVDDEPSALNVFYENFKPRNNITPSFVYIHFKLANQLLTGSFYKYCILRLCNIIIFKIRISYSIIFPGGDIIRALLLPQSIAYG